MNIEIIRGVLIPFLGTVLGSACVFFLRKNIGDLVQRALTGFAAGVMVAASIWSLLIPAMEQSAAMGKWSFVPAVAGFWVGILFLLLLDHVIPHLHMKSEEAEGPKKSWQKSTMLLLAVATSIDALAVGVTFAFLKVNILLAVCLIGVITFALSVAGVRVGNVFGKKYKSRAELAGGVILILMGLKILLEHLGVLG